MATKHTVTIMGSKVAYWVSNPDKKRVIVMVHGFRGTHEGLDEITSRLGDFQVIVPDLPGFGESTPFKNGNSHDIEHYAAFLKKFLQILELDRPVLLGHSFGSIIAAHFTAQNNAMIDKLILVNPINAPALKGPKAAMTQLAVIYYGLSKKLPEKMAKKLMSNKQLIFVMSTFMAKTKDKELRKEIHQQHYTHFSRFATMQTLEESFHASVSHTAREVAHNISVPTLLIAGDKDDITSIKVQHAAVKDYPKGELITIKDVGHLIHYEKPVEAVMAINVFLGSS